MDHERKGRGKSRNGDYSLRADIMKSTKMMLPTVAPIATAAAPPGVCTPDWVFWSVDDVEVADELVLVGAVTLCSLGS